VRRLTLAWALLPATGGVLFGDDWGWPGVHTDVLAFAACLGRARGRAVVHATELGRQMKEPRLQHVCQAEPTVASLMRRISAVWEANASNTGRFCVEGHHEIVMFGVGQWVLIKTPESTAPEKCAALPSVG
jgi:hypothetical protein